MNDSYDKHSQKERKPDINPPSFRPSKHESLCSPAEAEDCHMDESNLKLKNIFHKLMVRMNVRKFRDKLKGSKF